MTIRISKLPSYAAGSKENKPCLLIYGDRSYSYILYDTDNTLLWRSDTIPEEAYRPGTRRAALREIVEEEIEHDAGSEIVLPSFYSGPSPELKDELVNTDPVVMAKKYPEIVWLADQELPEIGGEE